MIKISVIIPVYNVEKYIDKCLSSLVNQTFKDYEILVINDGSPDNSQKIIDEYVKKYPNLVKSFIKENGGQGSARNLGIEKAKGKYVMFVDSDDYVENNMLEKMYNAILKDNYDIVVCNNYVEYLNGKRVFDVDEGIYNNRENKAYFFSKPAVWNKIFKKSLITDNNIVFREKLWYEDFDFTVKLYGLTNKIGFIDDYLYNYLLRPGSTMNNSNIERNLEILTAFDEIIKFFKDKDMYDKYYDNLEFLAVYNIYIATTVRVINANVSHREKKRIINVIKDYMKKYFPNFNENIYITNYLNKNRRLILKLINIEMYSCIELIFKVKNIFRR